MRRKYEIDEKGEVYGKSMLKPKTKNIRAPMEIKEDSTKSLQNTSQVELKYITVDISTKIILNCL